MANLEDVIRDLREKNSELVVEVQYLKIADAQKQKENLDLMKENNELRLKLSRLKSAGEDQARKLYEALQSASGEALSHLVQASGAVARTVELTKQYMQERQELESASPRWSAVSTTPSSDKVHKVPPLLLGGQSIQPVVALSRTILDSSTRPLPRSSNRNPSLTERTVLPMHMLQDLYIPLQRIDIPELQGNNMSAEQDAGNNINEDNEQSLNAEESHNFSGVDEYEESSRLEAVTEDVEPEENNDDDSARRSGADNPLEGPSWLLDLVHSPRHCARVRMNFEPDSTTPCDEVLQGTPPAAAAHADDAEKENTPTSLVYTPTMRRRKRASTPPPSPRPHRASGRVLKVVVAKMRLSEERRGGSSGAGGGGDSSPPKRPALADTGLDAPSPNGTTHSGGIVVSKNEHEGSGEASHALRRPARARQSPECGDDGRSRGDRRSRNGSRASVATSVGDSDSSAEFADGDGRTRRPRKQVSYKEKPLNRKLRR